MEFKFITIKLIFYKTNLVEKHKKEKLKKANF
jgi:hypothetical protein